MIKGRVSVIIPSRNERFIQPTIDGLLANARGDVEIIPILDGYWPNPALKTDPRVKPLHFDVAVGMRPGENAAIATMATGEFILKIDAHCIVAPGYDLELQSACAPGDLVVPTRHSIDGATWLEHGERRDTGAEFPRAIKPRHFNYHLLTYPFLPSMYGAGLHGVTFDWKKNREVNEARQHLPIDDLMSFQGSCWFQRKADFDRLGPLDHEHYDFYSEAIEVGLRVWMTGGRCLINKKTWYAHLHKGNNALHTFDGRVGRGFYLSLHRKRASEQYNADFWLNDRWPGATRTFVQFIEHFWPLLSQMKDPRYAWPEDWREFEKHRAAFEHRTPDQIPAHL